MVTSLSMLLYCTISYNWLLVYVFTSTVIPRQPDFDVKDLLIDFDFKDNAA